MIQFNAPQKRLLALLAGAWLWLETFRKSRLAAFAAVLFLPIAAVFAGIGYLLFYLVKSVAFLIWRIVSFPFVVAAQAVAEVLELVRRILLFPIRLTSRIVEAVFETVTTIVLFPFRLVCAVVDSAVALVRTLLFFQPAFSDTRCRRRPGSATEWNRSKPDWCQFPVYTGR